MAEWVGMLRVSSFVACIRRIRACSSRTVSLAESPPPAGMSATAAAEGIPLCSNIYSNVSTATDIAPQDKR